MISLSLILSFIFGAVVGSFLNVVSLRFNTGKGIGGRSMCMSCGEKLTWRELIPLASFIFQNGACRKCKSRISWQYPLIEFAAGAIFVLVLIVFPPTSFPAALETLLYIIATCLLLVIAAYDAKHKIIPDQFAYSLALVGIAHLFFGGAALFHMPSWTAILAGPLMALPFVLLWLVSKGRWMGLGDAKLSLGLGWLLGLYGAVNAFILAFWIGAAVSVIWLFATYGKFKPRTEIPFGPYLIIGFYLVLFFGIQVLDVDMLRAIISAA